MTDDDFKSLFDRVEKFDDDEAFVARACHKVVLRQRLRQGAIMVSGGIGGLYALGQIVHMPKPQEAGTAQGWQSVAYSTDTSIRMGTELLESVRSVGLSWLDGGLHALNLMQSPHFFWLSFVISLVFLGLYFAYAQEETI
jgi:hypothetical protein